MDTEIDVREIVKDLVTGKNVSSCAKICWTNTQSRNFIDNVLNRLCQSSGPEAIGPDEIASHSYTLKNLADGRQQGLANNTLIATLREERQMLPDK